MNEDGLKEIEIIILFLVLLFTTYPLFVDIQEKPEIAYKALRQSAIFSVFIVVIGLRVLKKKR